MPYPKSKEVSRWLSEKVMSRKMCLSFSCMSDTRCLFATSKHFKFNEYPLANSPFCSQISSFKKVSGNPVNYIFSFKKLPRLHDIQHMKHDNVEWHQQQLMAPDCTLTLDTSFERKGKTSLRRINLRCEMFPGKILETSDICSTPKCNKQRQHFIT